jgi:ATP synthase protein I
LNRASPDNPSKSRAFFSAAQFASLGLEMGLCIAIGVGIGYFLDSRFGTRPWLLLFFLLCGIAAAGKAVYDAARRAQRSESASNPQTDGDHGTQGPQAH